MAVGTQLPPRLQRPVRALQAVGRRPMSALDELGAQLSFYARSLAWTYRVLLRYKKEVVRLLAEVSLGSGALALVGGTVGVIAFLTFFTGTERRSSGLRRAQPARRRQLHGVHLGVLQHP